MLLFALLCGIALGRSWFPPITSEDCSYTRDDAFKCLEKYVDVDPKDGQITKKEVDAALYKYLPTYLKPLFYFIGTSKVFADCDYDKNGVITPRDWLMAKDTCMAKKPSWCTVQWFCQGAN